MKKYFEHIGIDELEEVFRNNGYIITNSDRIFDVDEDEKNERDSLFVVCKDTEIAPYIQKVRSMMGPLSIFLGGYADDMAYRIFSVKDYFIDEICAMYPEEVDEKRLHNLNETYRFKMACKFPEYKQDFEEYRKQVLATEDNSNEMGD